MSFKNLMKQYAGKASMNPSTSHQNNKRSALLDTAETSISEQESYVGGGKKARTSSFQFLIVFQLVNLSVADSFANSIPETIASFNDKLNKSPFKTHINETEAHVTFDENSKKLMVFSSSKSILESIAFVVSQDGNLLESGSIPSCDLRLIQSRAIEMNDNRFLDRQVSINYLQKIETLSVSIVIARYREKIDWVPNRWKQNVFLYNKHHIHPDETAGFKSVLTLPNVGRESHTYLYHIIENYENLTDIVYFTQAHPFDHSPHFICAVDCNIGLCRPYQGLSNITATVFDLNVNYYERMFPGIQEGFTRTIRELFGDEFGSAPIRFYPGAIISVHKSLILRRPVSFYRKCLELLSYSVDPIEGYAFERIWSLIFDDSEMVWPPVLS